MKNLKVRLALAFIAVFVGGAVITSLVDPLIGFEAALTLPLILHNLAQSIAIAALMVILTIVEKFEGYRRKNKKSENHTQQASPKQGLIALGLLAVVAVIEVTPWFDQLIGFQSTQGAMIIYRHDFVQWFIGVALWGVPSIVAKLNQRGCHRPSR